MLQDWRPPSQSGQAQSLCPSLHSSWPSVQWAVLHCTEHCTPHPIITQSIVLIISNYLPLGKGSPGKTKVSRLYYSVRRGGIVQYRWHLHCTYIDMIYIFQCHNLLLSLPPHLMRWPLLPSDLKFCFQVCIDFPLSRADKLDREHTHHTLSGEAGQEAGRYNVLFYIHKVTDTHPWETIL